MNFRIVCKVLGFILLALGVSFAISITVGWIADEPSPVTRSASIGFSISMAVAFGMAAVAFIMGRNSTNRLFPREAFASIGLGWLLASVVGALPYGLILPGINWADAIFESASGLTTTGASVLNSIDDLPASLHFWRCFSQWLGGLGVVVFFVAILSFLGAGAKILFSRESSANAADLGTARIQSGVFRLMIFYLGFSATCAVAFRICGLSWFDAVLHMFTTVSTGGFSTRGASIAAFQNPVFEWTVIVFMFLGGTSFILLLELLRGRWSALRTSSEFITYAAIVAAASIAIAILIQIDYNTRLDSIEATLRTATFQVVSIITTTGFGTADFNLWLPATHVILLLLMVIGGCAGSTAGGVKIVRIIAATKIGLVQIEKTYRRHVVRTVRVNGKPLPAEDQEGVLVYLLVLGMVLFGGVLAVALFEPSTSLEGIVSAVAACAFNIGPGLAEVGPMSNFANLHSVTKLLLAFIMVLGRIELFAILALFSRALWRP